jgi:hypothetical protein
MPFSSNFLKKLPLFLVLATTLFMMLSASNTALAFAPTFPRKPPLSSSFLSASTGDENTKNEVTLLEADNRKTTEGEQELSTRNTMMVKNIPTGEIKEVPFYDPDMEANTDVTMISPWAVLLFGFPTILLLNDAFHFFPNDGIWGQMQHLFR